LRRDAKYIYNFFEEENGNIKANMTNRYELHNLSQEDVTDPITLELDPLGGNEYNIVSVQCIDTKGVILVSYEPGNEANNKNITITTNDNKITINYSVTIEPESHVIYKTVYERLYDNNIVDATVTKVPVINAEIIINFPATYHFNLTPTMSIKPKLISSSLTQKIYNVEGGILPYQGFIYYLTRKS